MNKFLKSNLKWKLFRPIIVNMSTRKGNAKKQGPKHQNTFTFEHNKNSKKSKAIAVLPNKGVCKKCYEILEWRKKYRKYKPLTQPRKCNLCEQKKVTHAYHVLCPACAEKLKVCAKCMDPEVFQSEKELREIKKQEMAEIEAELENIPLRLKKSIKRKLRKGELDSDEEEDEEGEEEEGEEGEVKIKEKKPKQEQKEKNVEEEFDDEEEEEEGDYDEEGEESYDEVDEEEIEL
jgi:hypothetical protein